MQAIGQGERALADVLKELAETKADEDNKPAALLMVEWFTLFLRCSRLGGSFSVNIQFPSPDLFYSGHSATPAYTQKSNLPKLEFELLTRDMALFREYMDAVYSLTEVCGFTVDHTVDMTVYGDVQGNHTLKFHPITGIIETVLALIRPLYRVDPDTAEKLRTLTNMDPSRLNYVERVLQSLCRELLYYYEGVLSGSRTGFANAGSGWGRRDQERLQAPLPRISSDRF
ncbi:hypothetical protein O152_gp196 [Pseudomonas phage PaBG]|uniref:hypothetical protein n=1 Tax=Pseudomonas phage PaBG TaxID=1335230 RepID=UPI00155ED51E|nr:hypothetical protein O152_gp196 [Pseudomonas phage PaBG]QKE11225.1 hypothetical protein PaBG_00290 [Pseudomonas phage PaBG]